MSGRCASCGQAVPEPGWENSPGVLPWRNEAGEPLMDAAALRLEYALDVQAWEERGMDPYDDLYERDDE